MTKTRDSVIPRSNLTAHMPPGAATPRSGVYGQVGSRSTNEQADSERDTPLPSTEGLGWRLAPPAHNKDMKKMS